MSSPRRIKKIIRGVDVDPHTTPEAAGRPIVFLIRVGTATCSRSVDSGGVDVDSHTTLEQGKILKIVPQALLKTLQTVDFVIAKS